MPKQPNQFVSNLPPTWMVVTAILIVFAIIGSGKNWGNPPDKAEVSTSSTTTSR